LRILKMDCGHFIKRVDIWEEDSREEKLILNLRGVERRIVEKKGKRIRAGRKSERVQIRKSTAGSPIKVRRRPRGEKLYKKRGR